MIEKVSSRQIIYLIAISRAVNMITMMPAIRMGPKNQDIWLIVIGSFFYTVLLYIPMLFLLTRFRDISLMKFMEVIFGKTIGKIVGFLYTLHFIRIAILFMYISTQTIRSIFLPKIPPLVTISLITITCIYLSIKGLEVIARSAEMLGLIVLIELIVLFMLGIPNIDLNILLPVYSDSTFFEINMGSIQLASIFTDIYILTSVVPNLEKKEESNKIFFKSVIYSLAIILVSIVFTQATLGIEQAKHSNFPFLTFVRLIDVKSFLQRIEAVFILMWMVTVIIRIATYLYISSQSLKEVLNRKKRTPCIYIIGALIVAITYYVAEYNPQIEEIVSVKLPEYIYYFTFKTGIPLVAVIVYFFRREAIARKEANS